MHAGSFDRRDIGLLPLRAFQFGIVCLVGEQELLPSSNGRASSLRTDADAYALMEDVRRDARGRILAFD